MSGRQLMRTGVQRELHIVELAWHQSFWGLVTVVVRQVERSISDALRRTIGRYIAQPRNNLRNRLVNARSTI